MLRFRITKKDTHTRARTGVITTAHGKIRTPAFVTVATNAVVKGGVTADDVRMLGGEVLLANTYHLQVRDQVAAVKRGGRLAKFMGWGGPTMTDSGGFQVFSLGQRLRDGVGKFANYDLAKEIDRGDNGKRGDKEPPIRSRKPLMRVDDDGVDFRSHIDGRAMRLTPELSMQIQQDIGADIIFAFDEPTSPVASIAYSREAMDRTHRWAERCLKAHRKKDQSLFGIVQGGPHEELRRESSRVIASMDFPGFGIGGSYHRLHKSDRFNELDWVIPHLPDLKVRHFLGIGGIEDMVVAVFQGCDMFDCVIPTREARHGRLYLFDPKLSVEDYFEWQYQIICGKKPRRKQPKFYRIINVCNRSFTFDTTPLVLEPGVYTLGYLYHLFKTQELLGQRLATLHNLSFYFTLMRRLRQWIRHK